MLVAYHGCPVGHLVIAITDQLLLNVGPLAVADLQLVSHHSQDEACLVVASHLLKLSSLQHHLELVSVTDTLPMVTCKCMLILNYIQ